MTDLLDTDLSVFRVYEPDDAGEDGYPLVWHRNQDGQLDGAIETLLASEATRRGLNFTSGVKHLIRAEAGHRCVRCGHPFMVGESGEWQGRPRPEAESTESLLDHAAELIAEKRGILWSPCDEQCTHGGPIRWRAPGDPSWTTEAEAGVHVARGGLEKLRDAGAEIQAPWRILTVHHLNEVKLDLRWWNLASLCQRCHLYIQRKVKMEAIFPLEHTEWFKPHAAGWYAWTYEQRNLTKGETLADIDRLLGLERMA
jgi:hypothetical protein